MGKWELSSETLHNIGTDSLGECAIYEKENNLLDTQGWKRFKPIAKKQKNLFQTTNQAKIRLFTSAPKFKYGFEVPKDYAHGIGLDNKNNNSKWQDIMELEMKLLDKYQTFNDLGLHPEVTEGFKKIRVHLIFDMKHDGRHKAKLVADGHLTDIPVKSVYSGVVSL